jgi:opacity protein-like surface antigen
MKAVKDTEVFPMKLSPFFQITSLAFILVSVDAFAGSWVDDDNSWKSASPYYYGDSTSPIAKDGYRNQSTRRRPKVRDSELAPFTPNSNNVSLDIGQNFLVGSEYEDSIGMQGTYTYGVSRLLAFSTSLGYSSHSNGAFSKLALTVGPRLNLTTYDRIIPYITGGLGFHRSNRSLGEVNSISGTMFGIALGGGADLQLTRETFFGAAMTYNQLFGTTKQTTIGPIDIASNYLTFMAHVGYTF